MCFHNRICEKFYITTRLEYFKGKYTNNALVEEMDAIILLNDNYADKGLFKGYIGDVMDNFIEKYGFVVADFYNPLLIMT